MESPGSHVQRPSKVANDLPSLCFFDNVDMHRRPTATPVKLMERSIYSARYCFVEHMKDQWHYSPSPVCSS
ncbi:unnamed protein product [Plutella xylostella]|uniref:(diamondback moth) hypothetical protein n=1 Tax=Plutella xylostella TaxID=51655 RepID=A0A8S4ESU3_PLUXY|nr:unnamed protein product [Plutella xylostella]